MATVPFHYVDLRAFCYATEDDKRVEDALRTLLPEEFPVERTETEGFHGDRILIFSARAERADDVREVLERLSTLDERERIGDELAERVDENCSLFLRLDKQRAFRNEVALGTGIEFRGKVEAYPAKRETAIENARTIFV